MVYEFSMNLYKTINNGQSETNSKLLRITGQIVCTGGQAMFEILRNNNGKVGMNLPVNNFYRVSKLIGLDILNLGQVH